MPEKTWRCNTRGGHRFFAKPVSVFDRKSLSEDFGRTFGSRVKFWRKTRFRKIFLAGVFAAVDGFDVLVPREPNIAIVPDANGLTAPPLPEVGVPVGKAGVVGFVQEGTEAAPELRVDHFAGSFPQEVPVVEWWWNWW